MGEFTVKNDRKISGARGSKDKEVKLDLDSKLISQEPFTPAKTTFLYTDRKKQSGAILHHRSLLAAPKSASSLISVIDR